MESFNIKGIIKVYDIIEGKKVFKKQYKNAFLDTGKGKVLTDLMNNHYTNGIVAIGDGTTKVSTSDTSLVNERFRKNITNVTKMEDKLIIDIFITQDEANFIWQEIGLYANDGTTTTLNSGTILNRALIYEEKNNTVSKSITWELFIN